MRVIYCDASSTELAELGREEFTSITQISLPAIKPRAKSFLQHQFKGFTTKQWRVERIDQENSDVTVHLTPQREPGENYGHFSSNKNAESSREIRLWTLVWVDFSNTSNLHSVGAQPIPNKLDRRGHLPGEQHKLRPCIVVSKRHDTVTVVPLSTADYNAKLTHSIEISKDSFSGCQYRNTPTPSYAVLDWITTVSPYRIFSLPDSAGKPLQTNKAPSLTPSDKMKVSGGLSACFDPKSRQNQQGIQNQIDSLRSELKTIKEKERTAQEELRNATDSLSCAHEVIKKIAIFYDLEVNGEHIDSIMAMVGNEIS